MAKLILSIIIFALVALFPFKSIGQTKTITVAVIDTGIDPSVGHLCKFGHKDFTMPVGQQDLKVPYDPHGHGTHIAGLIVSNAGTTNYCLVSIRFYKESNTGKQNLANTIASLQYALNIKADFVNFSGGGPESSPEEKRLVKSLLDRGTVIVSAAGNEKHDLGDGTEKPVVVPMLAGPSCNYYPACYDARIVVVGNLETYDDYRHLDKEWQELGRRAGMGHLIGTYKTRRAPSSNYGTYVKRWEIGTNLKSTLPGGMTGYMSGTSQATAVATGKLLKQRGTK